MRVPMIAPTHPADSASLAQGYADRRVPVSHSAVRRWFRLGIGISAIFTAVLLSAGCNRAPSSKATKAIEVVVTTPITDEVTDYQDFTGRLEAIKIIDIRARVSGYVTEIPFKEGDLVKEGDLLFRIDPRSYQADADQAVANFKQAETDRKLQDKHADRARRLHGTSAISEDEYDQMIGNLEKAVATAGAMEAARDRAKLFLEYTRVTAPVTGRVSRRNVDPGNLVRADETLLTTIVTEDPMYAYFDVDERTYLDLVGAAPPGKDAWGTGLHYPVLMRLANEEEFVRAGVVNFVDNRVNGNTGTIRMRGVFENPKRVLKSGLFVRIRLPVGTPYKAVLIPDEAVLSDQGRKYVYVVNDQNEVEYRSVKLGQAIQDLRVVKEGVAVGERVIVNGMQRVRPKSEVEVKLQDPPKPPNASLGKRLTFGKGRPATGAGGD
jgi:RND family efflux transporter MFP subunit